MISHHDKTVFVHIPKTAGQSIETVFLDRLGLTWETRAPLLLRRNDQPEIGPRSLAHLTAQQYTAHHWMTQEQFDSYFKFAFVRNPWARVVSHYRMQGAKWMPFKQFVKTDLDRRQARPQVGYVCSDTGDLLVDFVGRFETLEADWAIVCKELGIDGTALPHVNRSGAEVPKRVRQPKKGRNRLKRTRARRKPRRAHPTFKTYPEYYDNETYELVTDRYREDISRFEYRFGEDI